MKRSGIFSLDISGIDPNELRGSVVQDNLKKSSVLSKYVIGIETVLAFTDIMTYALKVDASFRFSAYLFMYLCMIAVNLAYYFYTAGTLVKAGWTGKKIRHAEALITLYITFMMSWGSVISLMDQKLYGQMTAFYLNLIICSIVFYSRSRVSFLPFSLSSLIVLIGLPFVQKNSKILIGHYANFLIILVVSIYVSRILYKNYVEDFRRRTLLERANSLLSKEIERNEQINGELFRANAQLKRLSVADELTGLSNRRGFQDYVDAMLSDPSAAPKSISAIMMDIDRFKQYNDTYGHSAGDQVLKAVAEEVLTLLENPKHFAARWGGEEFVFLAFDTDETEIIEIAEKIRAYVEALKDSPIFEAKNFVTISLGTCTMPLKEKSDVEHSVDYADKALYLAKNSGRNCVKTYRHKVLTI